MHSNSRICQCVVRVPGLAGCTFQWLHRVPACVGSAWQVEPQSTEPDLTYGCSWKPITAQPTDISHRTAGLADSGGLQHVQTSPATRLVEKTQPIPPEFAQF